MAGIFVCRCGRAAGPRPLVEAKAWGVSLWVRNLIHRRLVAEGVGSGPRYKAIVAGMVAVARAVQPSTPDLSEMIEEDFI